MKNIRELIENLKTELDYLTENDPNVDIDECINIVSDIENTVDELESNNTDVKDIAEQIEEFSYLRELYDDIIKPLEANAKSLY